MCFHEPTVPLYFIEAVKFPHLKSNYLCFLMNFVCGIVSNKLLQRINNPWKG